MKWLVGDEQQLEPWSDMAAWQLVDAAEQAAGWLVEPAVASGHLELLTASLQLSQAAELLVDREASGRPHVHPPGREDLVDVCGELATLVRAARDKAAEECAALEDAAPNYLAQSVILLDQARSAILGSLR